MTTFAVTDPNHTIAAINYALSNLGTGTSSGNVTLPGNVLVANTTTGVISSNGNTAQVFGYLYQWINLRYSNNSTGGGGSFNTNQANANYYGVFNSTSSSPSSNPTDYQWFQVAGGFGTTKTLYYSAIGGRQVQWAAANSAPSSDYVPSVANVAINLDIVTTAAGTPGQRGPIAMAYVLTTADPNFATAGQLTTWFSAPRDATSPPIGTGLAPPVVGDTAQFTYINGTTNPSVCYTYNGSIWVPVDAQVVSGNVIVDGTVAANAIIAGSITATQIAADTITGNNIAGNTITATNIQTATITADQIAGNTITGNNIAAGTITTNNFTANTIQGNIIAAGTITAEQLAANAITANTVVSTGATLGSNTSPGFWLDGSTGNARFGNSISIGSQLTVGSNANIGGNLFVSGLITGGGLNSNTVTTTTVAPGNISSGFGIQSTGPNYAPPATGIWLYANSFGNISSTASQTGAFIFPSVTFTLSGNTSAGAAPNTSQTVYVDLAVFNGATQVNVPNNTYILSIPVGTYPSSWSYTITSNWTSFFLSSYAGANVRIGAYITRVSGPPYFYNIQTSQFVNSSLVIQGLKR
jgi:hypothetical protein